MRKILFLSLATLAMVGCSKDDEAKLSLSTNSTSLFSENTEKITASEPSTWGSDNEFVATVSDNGIVTGEHVGKAIITATSSNGEAQCQVEVRAQYNTYADPVFEFGASKSTIKSKEGRALDVEKEESLLFKPEKSAIQGVGYIFKNGKMTSIGVNVKLSSALEATNFLIERYLVIGAGVGDIVGIMINNLPNKANMAITMSTESGYVLVMYMPYKKDEARSAVEKDIMINEMKELFNSTK